MSSRPKVLCIEDDAATVELLVEVLEDEGFDPIVAFDGIEGVRKFGERPNVILCDVDMPHMSGFDLISNVRQSGNPGIEHVPAAALTAYARSEDRARALRAGFQLHLSKPIDPSELTAAVASLSKRSRSRR